MVVELEQYSALFAQFAQGDDFFQSEGANLRDLLKTTSEDVLVQKCGEIESAWKGGIPLLQQLEQEDKRPFVYVVMHRHGLSVIADGYKSK